jgi:hypothetical protein
MRIYQSQVIAGTRLDLQGEQLPREVLDEICAGASGKRLPVHQHHNMALPVVGYMNNLRVLPDDQSPGEWSLVADLYLEDGSVDEVRRGFSISTVVHLRQDQYADAFVHVPYPYYNDQEFIGKLLSDPSLNVGKWVKKSAEATDWVLFGATLVFVFTPIWDHIYKTQVHPLIERFLERHGSGLVNKGLQLEHVQLALLCGHQVEIRFIPAPGLEKFGFEKNLLCAGLGLVAALESRQQTRDPGIARVILTYDPGARAYEITRLEYIDGTVDHAV